MTRLAETISGFAFLAAASLLATTATVPTPRTELRWGAPTAGAVERNGYVHAPCGRSRSSVWVMEYLDKDKLELGDRTQARRRDSFRQDMQQPTEFRATERDYRGQVDLDIGHLCPAGDCTWSEAAMSDSFLLTNTIPQDRALNRGAWRRLEEYIRSIARQPHNQVWVCTIPLWMPAEPPGQGTIAHNTPHVKYEVIGGNHLPVPTHLGKAVLIRQGDNGPIELKTWLFPNGDVPNAAMLDEYRVTVDRLEHWSGLDLWRDMADREETMLEAREP